MRKSKKIINSLLLSFTFACMGGGGFLMESQFDRAPAVALAEASAYDEITNSLPNYFGVSTNASATFGNVDNKIFLISNTSSDEINIQIADSTKKAKGKDSSGVEKDITNYCYYPDGNASAYYYFKFSNSLSLYYDITNTQIENGQSGKNLIEGKAISLFSESTTTGGVPNNLTFTPEQLNVTFKLGTGNDCTVEENTITLNKEGCYTLSVPVVVYRTTNDGSSFVASEETVNYTFMALKSSTYFNQTDYLPNIAPSSNIQKTTVQGVGDYSLYYFYSYSTNSSSTTSSSANGSGTDGSNTNSSNTDADIYTLPTLEFDPNIYQFQITYTDTDQKIKTARIEYTDKFTEYDENGNEISEDDYFVWTSIGSDNKKAKLVFNDLGTYDLEISYLYKSAKNKIYSLPLERLTNATFENKLQRMFIYGYQTFYSNYDDIDPLTNQPTSSELKTLDTKLATSTLGADITMGVNRTKNEKNNNPTTNDLSAENLKESALSYINGKNKSPVTTNQTPIRFVGNVKEDTARSGLYKLTKNGNEWTPDTDTNLTFSLLNQNTPGVYLYVIQYQYDYYMSSTGLLQSNAYHYQVFFFEVTNLAPTVSLYEENQNNAVTQLYTRGFTNKSVYIIDNSTKNPYDAKVSISITAYDYVSKRTVIDKQEIDSFAGNGTNGIAYKTFDGTDGTTVPSAIRGKSGLYISNNSVYANSNFTIEIKARKKQIKKQPKNSSNATTPSITTFTIDTKEIENIGARKVRQTNSTNFAIGEKLSQNFTNEPIILSWNEKASGAPTYGYLKYIPFEAETYYSLKKDETTILNAQLKELLSLDDGNNSMLPVNYKIDLSKFESSTWVEYSNTSNFDSIVSASAVKQNSGFYLLEVYDGAGNSSFEIFLIDKTSPIFVKQQEELDENGELSGIVLRSIIANGENIDIPEDVRYDMTIIWAKYKGILLTSKFDDIKAYEYSKDASQATEALKAKLEEFFNANQDYIGALSSSAYAKDGTYLKIETFPTYYALDNDTYGAHYGYSYNVPLYKENANGELEALEATHSLLTRDKSNTKVYGDEATNYKNAPSGILNFRVSSDASKLDIKVGDKPSESEQLWKSLQWDNYSFSGYFDKDTKGKRLSPTETNTENSSKKYKYSYILPTNSKNKLSLTYIPFPNNGSVVGKITLKYYPFIKTSTSKTSYKSGNDLTADNKGNVTNNYFYYTLSKKPTREFDIYTNGSVAVAKGEECTFEIVLGNNTLPVAGKYVFERVYDSGNMVGKFDYDTRDISFIVDAYNVISPIESVEVEADGKTSLESVVGGDILVSMYSGEGQQNIEISFPRYINGLNQGSFYTRSSFNDEDTFPENAISISGNKLPLSLLIPQTKYTISSIKGTDNTYSVDKNFDLSYYGAEVKEEKDEQNQTKWNLYLEGILYKSFTNEEDALAELNSMRINVYNLYAKVQYYKPNQTIAESIYHGGNLNALISRNDIYTNGYMNFYKQTSSSQSQSLALETNPTKQFTAPGTYVVSLYQANNLGATFDQLYSLYKFAFKIEKTAPEFDIVDNSGYSLEEHDGAYYTNSSNLSIKWQIPSSDYIAKIDEAKIVIRGDINKTISLEEITGDNTAGGTRSFEIDVSSILSAMFNNSDYKPSITITMQFEGHNGNIYSTTSKTIYFDITAPHENILSLMSNVEQSARLQGAFSSLDANTLHSLTREYFDYNGNSTSFNQSTSGNGVSYSYVKSTGTLKYYYYVVNSQFVNNLTVDEDNYGVKYIGLKEVGSLESYTPVDKNSFNESKYTELSNLSVNNNSIYEVVERDWAGNMTAYLIKVVDVADSDNVLTYKNSKTAEDAEIKFSRQQMIENNYNLYSNTGFEITSIDYNSDEWEIFLVRKAGQVASIYMRSPWLDKDTVYVLGNSNFNTVSLSSLFSGLASSNRKHQLQFANRNGEENTTLFLTIYNANLITSTSYKDPQAQLNINIPSQESLNSNTYGYVFPTKIKVERLNGNTYEEVATAQTNSGLYGTWNIADPSNSVNITLANGKLTLSTIIASSGEKLRYTITDNFGNESIVVQLANIASYNEIVGNGSVYEVTESDNSKTYISEKDVTFNYHLKLYDVVVYNETDSRLATNGDYFTSNKDSIRSLTFNQTNKCFTLTIYDAADIGANRTPLRTIHIRIYNKLPAFTNSATLINGGVAFLDRNLNAFSDDKAQNKTLSQTVIVGGKSFTNAQATYLSTYSSVVTMKYLNSPSDNGTAEAYKKEYPYSAYISSDNGQSFTKLEMQDGNISSYVIRGAGDYLIFFIYDDETILTNSYKAYMVTIWDSTASYYTITIDGVRVERSNLTYTDNNGVTYEVNYLVGVDYSNRNRVIITRNEELGVVISDPEVKTTGTNVYVEVYTYSCTESSGSFAILYIKPNNDFASLFSYESPSGASESLLGKANETIVASQSDTGFERLKLTFTPFYGITSNRIHIKVEKMFEGNFVDVSPEIDYTDTLATAYITRAGYYRISLHDSCEPANYQTFKGSNYMYLFFLNSIPFTVTSTDSEGNTTTTEAIQNTIYNSRVTLSLTNLSSFYAPSNYPQITVYRNGKVYNKSSGGNGYIERNYTFTFSEPGYYQVDFSAKSAKGEVQIKSKTFNFMIISKNESRSAFNFPAYSNYYISKIEKSGLGDITEDFLNFGSFKDTIVVDGKTYLSALSLNYLDEKTGTGRYKITICPNEKAYENVGVKCFTFELWINHAVPPIEVSIGQGQATTNDITITFNVANFYEAVGDSYIKIGSTIRYYNAETLPTLNETEVITLSQSGTYYIQVYTASGQLIYSYKVIKNEPLNAFAIIAIILGVIALGTIIFITVKLRKRQRVK